MESLSIEEILHACGAVAFNCSKIDHVKGISTDTRKLQQGDLFVALKGENFDGHEFVTKALESGAAVVLSQKELPGELPYILVKDTLKALHNLAKTYKKRFQIPFVAVTGSSGKTTTKDMVASVLKEKYKVLKTEGNFNNEIGLPLTLFNLDSSHEICVLEMGMSSLGEIEVLADIVRPDVGIISNIGTAHIENLKSRDNILKAKTEMFTYFSQNNIAVINGDDDMLQQLKNKPYQIVCYGRSHYNDYIAENIIEKDDGIDFELLNSGKREKYHIPIPGIHNVYNALSAICIGKLYHMNQNEIQRGLSSFKPSKMRMEIFQGIMDIKVINDSYNANPDSTMAAIQVLSSMDTKGRRVCILGDMFELGDYAKEGHNKVGRFAAESKIDVIIAVGKMSSEVINGASLAGGSQLKLIAFEDVKAAMLEIKKIIKSSDVVLIKGSRGMFMENIVDILREGRSYE